jgi:hypothetical protein
MQFNNKTTRSVADAVSKILEGTHPKTDKEKDLAALAHPKDKITHKDVLVGRGVLKKEETDCEAEAKEEVKKHEKKMHGKGGDVDKHEKEMHKESALPFTSLIESYKKDGLKSIAKMKKEDVELDEAEKMKGEDPCWDSHEMVGHKMKGGKKVPNCVPKNEEVDTETYEKEMKDQKDKFDGKKKGGDVAKASVQAVKVEEEVEQLDEISLKTATSAYVKRMGKDDDSKATKTITHIKNRYGVKGVARAAKAADKEYGLNNDHNPRKAFVKQIMNNEEVELDERTLTEPETKKKEEVVKSMKKNLQGFKDRYGDKAKSVMYATATKIAKKD